MEVFIGNLHAEVGEGEVRDLLGVLGRDARLDLKKQRARTGEVVRYMVLGIEPESLGHKVISQLKGARLRGQPLVVREFVQRIGPGHQRDRAPDWGGSERRAGG